MKTTKVYNAFTSASTVTVTKADGSTFVVLVPAGQSFEIPRNWGLNRVSVTANPKLPSDDAALYIMGSATNAIVLDTDPDPYQSYWTGFSFGLVLAGVLLMLWLVKLLRRV